MITLFTRRYVLGHLKQALRTNHNNRGLSSEAEASITEGERLQRDYTLDTGGARRGSRAGSVARQILDRVPQDHRLRAKAIDLSGQLLLIHYQREENYDDLKRATECYEELLDLHPQGTKGRDIALLRRAKTLLLDFEHRGHDTNLSSATVYATRALELCATGSVERREALSLAAQIAKRRFESAKDPPASQLDEAITLEREALSDASVASRATTLNALGVSLRMRYQLSQGSSIFDIQDAMWYHQESLDLLSGAGAAKGETLIGLANTLLVHYEAGDNASSLDTSIDHLRQAANILHGIPTLRRTAESRIASALSIRYHNSRAHASDLDEAIQFQRHASNSCMEDHKDFQEHLHQLGLLLDTRYAGNGGSSDLIDAIGVWRKLRKNRAPGSDLHRVGSRRLADRIEKRYQQSPTESHLQELINLRTELVEHASDDDPDLSNDIESLQRAMDNDQIADGGAGTQREQPIMDDPTFTTTTEEPSAPSNPPPPATLAPLTQPTSIPKRATSQGRLLQPSNSPSSPGYARGSAAPLLYIHDPSNITNVIGDYRQRLADTPRGHPDRERNMKCLAEALQIRFGQNDNISDLEESDRLMETARKETGLGARLSQAFDTHWLRLYKDTF